MQVLWIKAWHQDGGSADDRRGRTTLLVRMRPIRIVQKSVWRCHAIHHVGIRRMPRNHELKYLALYPRQSPVDPCVIRSPSDIFIVYSPAVYSPAVAIIVNGVNVHSEIIKSIKEKSHLQTWTQTVPEILSHQVW